MSAQPSVPLQLNASQAAFLCGPVAINAASHDAAGIPSITRAFGCRLTADRREVVILLSTRRSQAFLRDLAAGAAIAVVFSRPKTHETLQLKGARGRIQPLEDGDRQIMLAYGAAFTAEIMALGYAERFSRALTSAVEDEAIAVAFTPNAAFDQTPGPKAGARLAPAP
jgi:hypothetical protein